MTEKLYKLDLESDFREKVENEIIDQILNAVQGAQDRDSLILEYIDQIEGITSSNTPARWKGACDLDSPITREMKLTMCAMIIAAIKRDPKVMVEANDVNDEAAAEELEPFISSRANKCNLNNTLIDIVDNTFSTPVGITYAGWQSTFKEERFLLYRPEGHTGPEDEGWMQEDAKEDGQDYEEKVHYRDVVDEEGEDIRPVSTMNFYLYPPKAKSIPTAIGCGERMMMTQYDILENEGKYGFEEEAVDKLLEMEPGQPDSTVNDAQERADSLQGLSETQRGYDDSYECFLWFCKFPLIREGGSIITPEKYIGQEIMCFVCPSRRVVLSMEYSRYSPRPYLPSYFMKNPGEFYGTAMPQIVNALQAEANANLRYGFDCLNMIMAPVMKVKQTVAAINPGYQVAPGSIFYYQSDPNEIMPLEFADKTKDWMGTQQYIESKAEKLYSNGAGQLTQKVRKSAEVQANQQAAASKFDMFLFTFLQFIEELAYRIVMLNMEHMDEEGTEFLDDVGNKHKMRPIDIRGKFIFRAVASSQMANPEIRVEMAQLKQKTATEYNVAAANPATPFQFKKLQWAGARKVLIDLGEHNPEEWIGKEPKIEDQPPPPQMPQPGPGGQPGAQPQPQGAPQGGQPAMAQ